MLSEKVVLTDLLTPLPYESPRLTPSLQTFYGVSGVTCHVHGMIISLFKPETLIIFSAEPCGLSGSQDFIHLLDAWEG